MRCYVVCDADLSSLQSVVFALILTDNNVADE